MPPGVPPVPFASLALAAVLAVIPAARAAAAGGAAAAGPGAAHTDAAGPDAVRPDVARPDAARGDEAAREPASLVHARRARELLGPGIWSEVLRIRNAARRGVYPETVYAAVFELEGILWFYTDADGTQSLSLRAGRADRDRADLGPLLRAISPGFVSWTGVADRPPDAGGPGAPRSNRARPVEPAPTDLPNGCLVESVAAYRRLVATGVAAARPRLLMYYVDTPQGLVGHTVLAFAGPMGPEAIDGERSAFPIPLPPAAPGDEMAVARYLRGGGQVASVRTLPLGQLAERLSRSRLAALPGSASPAGE